MDEILIEDKKYVSSKRAAKVTGYAKDYIGQLCREGRVPARLVGRSWYVLESAIHDHRFGKQGIEPGNANPTSGRPTGSSASVFPSTWESPRYEASSAEILPSVNRLQRLPGRSDTGDVGDEQNEMSQHLQDSWKAWFDRVADTESVTLSDLAQPEGEEIAEKPEVKEIEEEEVRIPINTVYELPPEDLLPRHSAHHFEAGPSSDEEEVYIQRERGGRGAMVGMQIAGAVFAVLVATVAVIGTGYFDEYIISNSQVGLIAGVALYNR
jgi:hypothetical protein